MHYLNNRSFINMFAFIEKNTSTLYLQFQFQTDQPFSLQITTIQSTTWSFQMGEVSISINMYNSTFKKIFFDPFLVQGVLWKYQRCVKADVLKCRPLVQSRKDHLHHGCTVFHGGNQNWSIWNRSSLCSRSLTQTKNRWHPIPCQILRATPRDVQESWRTANGSHPIMPGFRPRPWGTKCPLSRRLPHQLWTSGLHSCTGSPGQGTSPWTQSCLEHQLGPPASKSWPGSKHRMSVWQIKCKPVVAMKWSLCIRFYESYRRIIFKHQQRFSYVRFGTLLTHFNFMQMQQKNKGI